MNKHTLKKLEFDKILEKLASLTYSEMGKFKALHIQPTNDLSSVTELLDQTSEAMELLRFNKPDYLASLKNVENHLNKAKASGILNGIEIYEIYHLLRCSRLTIKYVASSNKLKNRCFELTEEKNLEDIISRAIDEEGFVKDEASPTLKSIRNQISTYKNRIKDYLQSFIRSSNNSKILQDNVVTERDGRYVIPVKQEYKNEIKGIIHDESASGATVFIEPMPVVDLNNKIRSLQNEEKREIEKILRELSLQITFIADELINNFDILSEFDVIIAKANYAYRINAFRPEVNNQGIILLKKARHPLLEENAIPVNIELGKDFDILVITGPNTGGKTVVLKTIGLLSLMTMSGIFIPAREDSLISVFDSIYVDIGDEQSIEQSLSTFSSHLKNIIGILEIANQNSLVLMDELGAGTDPVEGAALARSILEELMDVKAKVVVTSHQSELKSFAFQEERVENACVEFDPISLKPTYELTIGTPGQSNAFEIALRLGLKNNIVTRARQLVPQQELEVGNMIKQLKESRYELDIKNKEIELIRKNLIEEKELFQLEKDKFIAEKDSFTEKARNEANSYLRKIRREADEAIEELKKIIKDREQDSLLKWHEIEEKRHKIKSLQIPNSEDERKPSEQILLAGDYVLVKNLKQKGYILEPPNNQGEITVQLGVLKINVKQDQVIKVESPDEKKNYQRNQVYLDKVKNISIELDLRGKIAEDALAELEKYIENANLAGLNSARIIHGKGTGALRNAVRNYLKTNRYIKEFRDGLREEGGHGVTIIELK